jgi:hypothetical protein
MDTNKDRFLSEKEFKKAQEAETKKMRAVRFCGPSDPMRRAVWRLFLYAPGRNRRSLSGGDA